MPRLLWALVPACALALSSHGLADEAADRAMATAVIAGDKAGLDAAIDGGGNVDTTIYIPFDDSQAPLSLLTMATLLGDQDTVRRLRRAGARIGDSCDVSYLLSVIEPLNSILPKTRPPAVWTNALRAQSELLCFLHTPYRLDGKSQHRELVLAIARGDLDTVKSLLSRGADKNAREPRLPGPIAWPGRTLLMIAILEQKLDIANFLVREGVDLDAKASVGSTWGGWNGFTALMLATRLGWPEFVSTLLSSGADRMLADEDGGRAVHYAAASGEMSGLEYLLSAETNADLRRQMLRAKTTSGETSLALATRSRQVEAARYLVGQGIALFGPAYLREYERLAVMESAISRSYKTQRYDDRRRSFASGIVILTIFLDGGADPNTADNEGVSLLMSAVRDGSELSGIQLLLERGADPLRRDRQGRTAAAYALHRRDANDVASLLAKFSNYTR